MPRILFICPTYGKFEYARQAVKSFFLHSTPDDHCLVVDDASPQPAGAGLLPPGEGPFDEIWTEHKNRFDVICHRHNEGLTACWTDGLGYAKSEGFEYAICGNSDILFTPFWDKALVHLLGQPGWKLVGPVSNCPGASQYGAQNVKHFYPHYKVSDDPCDLEDVATQLYTRQWSTAAVSHINGFFMMAKTATWWEGAYDAEHVFRPRNDFNSKGQRNPTPLMTLNEDELQGRWREKGWLIGFSPASFIFHYRAATRGGSAADVEGAYRLSSDRSSQKF